jgi:hypothetical protein
MVVQISDGNSYNPIMITPAINEPFGYEEIDDDELYSANNE